jgi:hypothetical protein
MQEEKLTENIRVRISKKMKDHLAVLASQRGPGTKLSDLAREAIHKTYFGGDPSGGAGIPPQPDNPDSPYPITEITSLRAAENPKKATGR